MSTLQVLGLIGLLAVTLTCAWVCAASVRLARREAATARRALDEVTDLAITVDTLRSGLKRIEGRQVKAQQRASSAGPDQCPDSKVDPEGWKRWQNARLAQKRLMQ